MQGEGYRKIARERGSEHSESSSHATGKMTASVCVRAQVFAGMLLGSVEEERAVSKAGDGWGAWREWAAELYSGEGSIGSTAGSAAALLSRLPPAATAA